MVLVLLGCCSVQAQEVAPAQDKNTPVEFVRDVQPIFVKSCYGCHGPKSQLGGLRLDVKETALTGGLSGKSLAPGHAADSLLYQRVTGAGEQARMPMGGKPLPADQIAVIRRWIEEGASWPDGATTAKTEVKKHWAFVAPQRPALPSVSRANWVRSPVDAFVLARLDKEQLSPSPAADRATLLRRLSLDLIGLPPTPAEVDAFIRDKSPQAYNKQVERLLASPHYGERWARHWLDAARYADSDGYEKDLPRDVWFYRDWVVRAFNQDKPYNQFVIDQIAGDLLPNRTQDQLVATGFLRNSMINEEGGIDPEQFRTEALIDRMEAIGKGVLGVTIQCAQCHNHKYDPLRQEEYYRLFAYLNDSHEGSVPVYTPADLMQRERVLRGIKEIEADLQHRAPDWSARMSRWEQEAAKNPTSWHAFQGEVDDISTGGEKYMPQKDGSFLCLGYAPAKKRVKVSQKIAASRITAIQLELLTDPNLPRGGPGRHPSGLAALSEFEIEAAPANAPDQVKKFKVAQATADFNMPDTVLPVVNERQPPPAGGLHVGPVEFAIDGKPETAWGTDAGPGERNQPRKAVFTLAEPIEFPQGAVVTIYLRQDHGAGSDRKENPNLGKFRLSWTDADGVTADPVPIRVREILARSAAERSPTQMQVVFRYWRTTVPEWKPENERIAALWREYPEGSSQLILQTRELPRETHMFTRGDWLQPGKAVEPGAPAFLNPIPAGAPANRLTLARWMVDRQAPTTARSFVNRVWQSYFGTGIVASSENLGTQADTPSHPELLDWLAVEFMEKGWSIKNLHRAIVTSSTYQQVSVVSPELLAKDPDNRLLARGPRFRVDAEVVRDIALASSGLLNPTVGGPSVFPPAPAFLFLPPVSYSPKPWIESKGSDRYRRALYTFRYRSVPYPVLQVFDAPNGDVSCVRRARANTPLQALAMLNEPVFLETARALAWRVLDSPARTDEQRLTDAFRRVLSRAPAPAESQELLALLRKQTERFSDPARNPWELAATDAAHPPKLPTGVTAPQAAAWTTVARVLLNLDETITKE